MKYKLCYYCITKWVRKTTVQGNYNESYMLILKLVVRKRKKIVYLLFSVNNGWVVCLFLFSLLLVQQTASLSEMWPSGLSRVFRAQDACWRLPRRWSQSLWPVLRLLSPRVRPCRFKCGKLHWSNKVFFNNTGTVLTIFFTDPGGSCSHG